jgi:serine protease AprX
MLQARPSLTTDQVKALLKSTATPLDLLDQNAEGSGLINVNAAANGYLPWGSTQTWTAAAGSGSINQARGASYVTVNGVALTGEQDLFGKAWKGATWATASAKASAWTGGSWNGSIWTGACLCGTSWAGSTWSGAQWSGAQWSAAQWSGAQWSGAQWSGAQWSGAQWSGAQWSSAQWS